MADWGRQRMATRIELLRSKEAGCRWAASCAKLEDSRSLFERLANQYRQMAEELELLDKLARPWNAPAE